jgi:hypothetical protein
MFKHDYGFGPSKWLWWFIGLMAVYAILTMLPDNGTPSVTDIGEMAGGAVGVAGIVFFLRRRIRANKEK